MFKYLYCEKIRLRALIKRVHYLVIYLSAFFSLPLIYLFEDKYMRVIFLHNKNIEHLFNTNGADVQTAWFVNKREARMMQLN